MVQIPSAPWQEVPVYGEVVPEILSPSLLGSYSVALCFLCPKGGEAKSTLSVHVGWEKLVRMAKVASWF